VGLLQIVLGRGLSAVDRDAFLRVQDFEHGFMTLNRGSGKVRPIGPNPSPPEAGIFWLPARPPLFRGPGPNADSARTDTAIGSISTICWS
jgi:hypothetical protein